MSKYSCPLFKGATFGQERTAAGSIRSDDNMQMVWIVEGDYDGGQVSVQQAAELLERHHVRALVVTTASHTPDRPRWRVLAPLSNPCEPALRYSLVARLNGALGAILAPESFTASQAYFFGRVEGSPFEWALTFSDPTEGTCVDDLDDLDQIAAGRREGHQDLERVHGMVTRAIDEAAVAQTMANLGRRLRTGDGRRDVLRSMAASHLARGSSQEQTMGELHRIAKVYFDPADPVDWSNIEHLVHDLHHKDQIRSQKKQAIIKPFLDRFQERASAGIGVPERRRTWVDALVNYEPPLSAWRDPKPVHWAVDGLIRVGTVGALIAPGATGKTTLLITLGICHALGMPFMGRPVRQGGFLLLSVDDAQEDLDAAVGLVIQAMGLDPQALEMAARYLRVLSLQGREGPRSFNLAGAPGQPDHNMLQSLRQACAAVPDLVGVCLDTLRQFAGGPTNAEEVIMAVSATCATVAVETGAYIVMPHHTGKAQARDDSGDMYVGSGSAAIADNARFLLVLSEVTERSELIRLGTTVQQEHNAGACTILRLASRRGSIRHQIQPDLFISRRGYLMQAVNRTDTGDYGRTLQVLRFIHEQVEGGGTSKNAVHHELGGNRARMFALIDELIERGLVTIGSANGSRSGAGLLVLTAAGAALLQSLKGGSLEAVLP